MKTSLTSVLLIGSIAFGFAASTINSVNKLAYGSNLGWVDWRADGPHGAVLGEFVCSGYIYSANTGWLNLGNGTPANGIRYQNNSASDFGVNHIGAGNLRGLAYGANIGWIHFEDVGAARIDLCTGKLSGFIYGANAGWISLSNAAAFVQTTTIQPGPDVAIRIDPLKWPATLSDTGVFTNLLSLTSQTQALAPNLGVVPYEINVPFWSDGARKTRWFIMPTNDAKIEFHPDANWVFPAGMVWVKHFDLEMTNGRPASARRLETRFLVKTATGVEGVTYRWDSLNNATRVDAKGTSDPITIYNPDGGILRTFNWCYPSRTDCVTCHNSVYGDALGFNTVQLNRDIAYRDGCGPANQLGALSRAGVFSAPVANLYQLPRLAHATNSAWSREWRVRSHLDANCKQCHQIPGSTWDARITTRLSNAGLIGRLIVPGSTNNSILFQRITQRRPGSDCDYILGGQMPPLATKLLDTQFIALISDWITKDLAWPKSGPLLNALPNQVVIQHSATNVTVSWPLPAPEIVLEKVNVLNGSPGSVWTTVPVSDYQTNANDISVSLPRPAGNGFYRLRKQ